VSWSFSENAGRKRYIIQVEVSGPVKDIRVCSCVLYQIIPDLKQMIDTSSKSTIQV